MTQFISGSQKKGKETGKPWSELLNHILHHTKKKPVHDAALQKKTLRSRKIIKKADYEVGFLKKT